MKWSIISLGLTSQECSQSKFQARHVGPRDHLLPPPLTFLGRSLCVPRLQVLRPLSSGCLGAQTGPQLQPNLHDGTRLVSPPTTSHGQVAIIAPDFKVAEYYPVSHEILEIPNYGFILWEKLRTSAPRKHDSYGCFKMQLISPMQTYVKGLTNYF